MRKRHIFLVLKLLFIVTSLVFVFWQADAVKIWGYLKTTNPLYLLLSCIIMGFAQIVSAYRMRFYYRNEQLKLGRIFSVGLYFTSMLFNTILPGGIGGDGYKIYTIGRLTGFSHLRALKIAVSERASGLFALLVLTGIFYIYADFGEIIPYQTYVVAALGILVVPAYFISTAIILKETAGTSCGAMAYSIPTQLLNAAVAMVLLAGIGLDMSDSGTVMAYLVIFMLSSVAAILPVTIGGAGLREITFLYGAKLTGLDAEQGITLALLFFIVNTICSLNGLFFWHRLDKLFHKKI